MNNNQFPVSITLHDLANLDIPKYIYLATERCVVAGGFRNNFWVMLILYATNRIDFLLVIDKYYNGKQRQRLIVNICKILLRKSRALPQKDKFRIFYLVKDIRRCFMRIGRLSPTGLDISSAINLLRPQYDDIMLFHDVFIDIETADHLAADG